MVLESTAGLRSEVKLHERRMKVVQEKEVNPGQGKMKNLKDVRRKESRDSEE